MTITRIGIVPGDGGLPVISKAVVRGDTVVEIMATAAR